VHVHLFDWKQDDGRADAALLTLYGLRAMDAAATHTPQEKEIANG
jgi:hypothetical protein